MKYVLFIFMFVSAPSFAASSICDFLETWEFMETVEVTETKAGTSRLTFAEKNLIHRSITTESFYAGVSRPEAISLFNEESSDGVIVYFTLNKKKMALVHYFPGDNEYGAFFEVRNSGAAKLVATVSDSFISCIEE